jgi:carbon monoxide dehydrogenase subunit G
MATIRHHAHIARSPEEVWKVVADPGAIAAWFPGIGSVTVEGNVRRCSLGPKVELLEEVVTVDDDLRRFQYRIVGGPLPVSFHLATVDVLPDGDGSLVIYSTDVTPDDAKDLIDPAIAAGVAGLKAHLES